jgi:hypothetical protein
MVTVVGAVISILHSYTLFPTFDLADLELAHQSILAAESIIPDISWIGFEFPMSCRT